MGASGAGADIRASALLDPDDCARILAAFHGADPAHHWAVLDDAGRMIAGTPPESGPHRALEVGGTVVGHLVADAAAPSAMTEALHAVLEVLAEQRARSAEEVERQRDTNLFYLLGETIGASMDPERIAAALVAQALRVAGADAAAMAIVDPAAAGAASVISSGDSGRSAMLADAARAEAAALAAGADLAADEGLGPLLTIHVAARGLSLGTLVLARPPGAAPFGERDERNVRSLTSGAGLERARYHQRELQRLRQATELAMGRRIQLGLLPRTLPQPEGWELTVSYEAAREVGGDFYDAQLLDRPVARLVAAIGDVTGKGVPAALMMAHARSIIRAAAASGDDPATVLERANRLILADGRSGLFLTALVVAVDLAGGRIDLASAGHEPALMRAANGHVTEVGGGGTLLGLTSRARIATASGRLEPGAALVAYTDGVTDVRSASGAAFGEDGLRRVVAGASGSAAELSAAITSGVAAVRGDALPFDDLTLVVLWRDGSA
jgi:serine phosphatase RsbU (regulator of sigma subunit)